MKAHGRVCVRFYKIKSTILKYAFLHLAIYYEHFFHTFILWHPFKWLYNIYLILIIGFYF